MCVGINPPQQAQTSSQGADTGDYTNYRFDSKGRVLGTDGTGKENPLNGLAIDPSMLPKERQKAPPSGGFGFTALAKRTEPLDYTQGGGITQFRADGKGGIEALVAYPEDKSVFKMSMGGTMTPISAPHDPPGTWLPVSGMKMDPQYSSGEAFRAGDPVYLRNDNGSVLARKGGADSQSATGYARQALQSAIAADNLRLGNASGRR